MLYETTPDNNGWYWVEIDDEWGMAYLEYERERPLLLLAPFADGANCFDANSQYEMRRLVFDDNRCWLDQEDDEPADIQPRRWIGPVECPAGPFGSEIAEFRLEVYEKAKRLKQAIVMVHADVLECSDKPGCTITTFGFMDGDEAYDRTAEFFKGGGLGLMQAEKKMRAAVGGCPRCEYDEADGGLYRHCAKCQERITTIAWNLFRTKG